MQHAGVKKVCILGGTHGNELSGVYMLKRINQNPKLFNRSTFKTASCLSNPRAVEVNRRYIDVDLNRSFSPENLAAKITEDTSYEVKRAQELMAMLSEGGEIGSCDVILDLHNTTANTKACLIYGQPNPFIMQLIHYTSTQMPAEMCYSLGLQQSFHHYCTRVLAPCGIGVEVGPQPQGVIRADIYRLQEDAVNHCLDFIESFNSGTVFPATALDTYNVIAKVPFPRNEQGDIDGVIHANLQDKDWTPIAAKDPVFECFDGRILRLEDVFDMSKCNGEVLYPMFINEAAYYERDVAFCLTRKVKVDIPELRKA